MKIYTKTGDAGETSLIGGQRVAKTDPRIEAIGAVDELNAAIGLAIALDLDKAKIAPLLRTIQHHLFDIGAELASLSDRPVRGIKIPRVTNRKIKWLEKTIDKQTVNLKPLKAFILPGGTPAASALHLARTTGRRAERQVIELAKTRPVPPAVRQYLNRLSDFLFTLARAANAGAGVDDIEWQKS